MKGYLAIVLVLFLAWYIVSYINPDPIWWSIFSSDRSTHTPMIEQVSLVKVTLIGFILWTLYYLANRLKGI
nr:hypothetical protein [Jeotgalibacillus malaysiensis]